MLLAVSALRNPNFAREVRIDLCCVDLIKPVFHNTRFWSQFLFFQIPTNQLWGFGVLGDTEPGARLVGNPAIPAAKFFRQQAMLARLTRDRVKKSEG